MVLVDTTVWIDFFSDRNEPHVVTLQELIDKEEDLSLCGVILAEVLQGVRSDTDFIKTKEYLGDLISCPCSRQHLYDQRRFTGPFESRVLQLGNRLIA